MRPVKQHDSEDKSILCNKIILSIIMPALPSVLSSHTGTVVVDAGSVSGLRVGAIIGCHPSLASVDPDLHEP